MGTDRFGRFGWHVRIFSASSVFIEFEQLLDNSRGRAVVISPKKMITKTSWCIFSVLLLKFVLSCANITRTNVVPWQRERNMYVILFCPPLMLQPVYRGVSCLLLAA